MLDWLKTILEDAYTDEIDKKVSEEIGKNFVARSDFNALNTEKKTLADTVKERDRQLETLKASTGDVEVLKTQIIYFHLKVFFCQCTKRIDRFSESLNILLFQGHACRLPDRKSVV